MTRFSQRNETVKTDDFYLNHVFTSEVDIAASATLVIVQCCCCCWIVVERERVAGVIFSSYIVLPFFFFQRGRIGRRETRRALMTSFIEANRLGVINSHLGGRLSIYAVSLSCPSPQSHRDTTTSYSLDEILHLSTSSPHFCDGRERQR